MTLLPRRALHALERFHAARPRDTTPTSTAGSREARAVLPGVRLRRRLFWRYTLVWRRR